jgi:hypothetical protein
MLKFAYTPPEYDAWPNPALSRSRAAGNLRLDISIKIQDTGIKD